MMMLKPSELPVGTTIEVEDLEYHGVYHKVDNSIYGIWWDSDGCEDCQGTLGSSDEQADERFKEFKIIALPPTLENDHDAEGHDCTVACTEAMFGVKASLAEINQMLWFMTGMVMEGTPSYKNGREVLKAVRQKIHDYNNPKPGEH